MSAEQTRDIVGSVVQDRDFGPVLRRYRVGAGLTQEELAQRAGLSVRAVSDMERGRTRKPFLRSVRQLANALGLPPAERALLIAAAEPEASLRVLMPVPAQAEPAGGRRFVPPVPRQLPSGAARFTGRAAELGTLAGLAELSAREDGTTVVISGTAGVGKTALAVHFAHQVAADFPDGQLYVNLRGAGPTGVPAAPQEAIRGFLTAFGLGAEVVPPDGDARAALLRSLLAGRRVLLVLDNALDEQQVRPLLPGSAGCMTVVTSRNQMAGLAATDGARLLDLRVLSGTESVQLLAARLGGERVADEPEAAARVSTLCARLPLALSVAAARAATRGGVPLAALADELRRHNPLDALETGDQVSSVRVVLSWSYRGLSPSAATMFRLLGLHVGTDISLPAAASLAGVPPPQARSALGELARANLLTEYQPDRYACHDLLRVYAAELARAIDGEAGCHAALKRILDYYLHTARAASQRLSLGRVQQHLGDYAGAIGSYEQALSLCRELGSRYYQSLTLSHLGDTYQAAGDPVTAARAWRKALDILIELNHPDADRVRRKLPARLTRVGPVPPGSAGGQPEVGDVRVADVRREDRGAVADAPDPGTGELWEVLTQDRHDRGVLHDVRVRLVPGHTGRSQ
jgi:transcriptional regulator with XRE-family HTH domain/tetratricopeptide (TPR) repeat protein